MVYVNTNENKVKFIYLFQYLEYTTRLPSLSWTAADTAAHAATPLMSLYLPSVPAMALPPGHDLAEELHQVVVVIQVQALPQV